MITREVLDYLDELKRKDKQLCCQIKALEDAVLSGGFIRVENYSALPDPALHSGEYFHVVNSEGQKFWPNWLGGADYYPEGFYWSDGAVWDYIGEFPYQATQVQVDAGVENTLYVTPATLSAATTVSHPGHTHPATDIGLGTVDDTEFSYLDGATSPLQPQIDSKADESFVIAMSTAL